MVKLLHTGFDTLHVAWCGAVSRSTVDKFEAAKERAQEAGEPVYEVINGLCGHVGDTGAKGGYRYIFDQGPFQTKWLIKKSPNPTGWNLFAQIGSRALAENGVVKCIENMKADLRAFDAKVTSHSVNRWDVCADIQSLGFEIEPKNILCHSRSSIQRHSEDYHLSVHGGARVDTITIGKMPGRQVQIYDKRKEHKSSGKSHWWKIWNIDDDKTPVWRVELRFGKNHNNDWNLKTLDDLARMGGDMVIKAMEDVRYLEQRNTVNASRSITHRIWHFVKAKMIHLLATATSGSARGKVRSVVKKDLKKCMAAQMAGLGTTLTGLVLPDAGTLIDEMGYDAFKERAAGYVYRTFLNLLPEKRDDFEKKIERTLKKYHFIEGVA